MQSHMNSFVVRARRPVRSWIRRVSSSGLVPFAGRAMTKESCVRSRPRKLTASL